MLLRQLRRRFGDAVDTDIEQRVATASIEQIDTWARAASLVIVRAAKRSGSSASTPATHAGPAGRAR